MCPVMLTARSDEVQMPGPNHVQMPPMMDRSHAFDPTPSDPASADRLASVPTTPHAFMDDLDTAFMQQTFHAPK